MKSVSKVIVYVMTGLLLMSCSYETMEMSRRPRVTYIMGDDDMKYEADDDSYIPDSTLGVSDSLSIDLMVRILAIEEEARFDLPYDYRDSLNYYETVMRQHFDSHCEQVGRMIHELDSMLPQYAPIRRLYLRYTPKMTRYLSTGEANEIITGNTFEINYLKREDEP